MDGSHSDQSNPAVHDETTEPRSKIVLQIGIAYAAALVLLAMSGVIERWGGFWASNAGTLPAAFCLLFPVIFSIRRSVNPSRFGLDWSRPGPAFAAAAVVAVIVFPPYIAGYHLWSTHLSGLEFIGVGQRLSGWAAGKTAVWAANLVLVQVVAVALPEEVFYRGWLQERLGLLITRRISVFGTPIGLHVVAASAMFAIAHVVLVPAPFRLAVFFPGLLFGYLRERTGSVAAPVILHAASNILLALLTQSYGNH